MVSPPRSRRWNATWPISPVPAHLPRGSAPSTPPGVGAHACCRVREYLRVSEDVLIRWDNSWYSPKASELLHLMEKGPLSCRDAGMEGVISAFREFGSGRPGLLRRCGRAVYLYASGP